MLYRKSPKAKECIVQSNISDHTMSETRVVNGLCAIAWKDVVNIYGYSGVGIL